MTGVQPLALPDGLTPGKVIGVHLNYHSRAAQRGRVPTEPSYFIKATSALSGGETARLLFCKLMLQKPNVLIFDEPTNHLDLESINALNVALQKYEGTVLLVTHDHDLIDEVGTRIWHFEGGAIEDFKGPYSEYQTAIAAAR